MTDRFKNEIIPWIFKWEGTTFENDPDDPGGATKFGIDQRSHPHVDIKNLTADQAAGTYWTEYCNLHCNEYAPQFDWVYFNCCVNCGVGRATKIKSRSGVDASKFLDIQEEFYRALAESRPSSKKYLKGWLARTEDLREVAGLA